MADPAGGDKWTRKTILIAVLMVSTGSINTLTAKWADRLEDKNNVPFDHPFVQAVCMFIGEFMCLIVYLIVLLVEKIKRRRLAQNPTEFYGDIGSAEPEEASDSVRKFNPLVFLPAAFCDMCATSIMYLGLNLTNAASFQMLRGAVVIFTGLLSVAFLRSKLYAYKWVGMLGVLAGLVVVGLADVLAKKRAGGGGDDGNNAISGDMLIIMAQVIVAIQMVYEQNFVVKYNVPALLAVGLEGLFGAIMLSLLLIPFYYIRVPETFSKDPEHRLDSALFAFKQMSQNHLIIVALMGTITSIAFFNFAGISMTKELSATTRMILDSVRTLFIWAFSLAVGWDSAVGLKPYLQVLGFLVLFLGMLVYNDILIGPTTFARLADRYPGLRCCCSWFYLYPGIEDALRREPPLIVTPEEEHIRSATEA